MNNTGSVCSSERIRDLRSITQAIANWESAAVDYLLERLARHILHRDEIGAALLPLCVKTAPLR